jgi:HNH endonuclease
MRKHGDLVTVLKRKGIINKTTNQGYTLLKMRDHPNANGNGWVLEHRAVMSKVWGRALFPDEEVHHKNGQRSDNRPENLEVWVGKHPSGQRPEDLVPWAREILRRYEHLVVAGD